MALRMLEGFETTQDEVVLRKVWNGPSVIYEDSYPAGRLFGKAFRPLADTAVAIRTGNLAGSQTTWIQGMGFRTDSAAMSAVAWILFSIRDNGGVEQITLALADGATGYLKVQVTQGSTVLYESTEFAITGVWQYLEWKVLTDTSAGTVEVRLNKVVILEATGFDSAASGAGGSYSVYFGCGSPTGGEFDIDDLYACDGSGSAPYQDFLGPVAVTGVVPVADFTPTEWAPSTGSDHYAVVDNPPTDGAPEVDYLEEDTVGLFSMVTLDRLQNVRGGILGAMFEVVMASPTGVTESLKVYHQRLIRGATQDVVQSLGTVSTSSITLAVSKIVVEVDPVTGEVFAAEDLEQGHVGVEKV